MARTASVAHDPDPAPSPAPRTRRVFWYCEHCKPEVEALIAELGITLADPRAGRPLVSDEPLSASERAQRIRTGQFPAPELGRVWRLVTQMWRLAHTRTVSDKWDDVKHRAKALEWWLWLTENLARFDRDCDVTARPYLTPRARPARSQITLDPRIRAGADDTSGGE